MSDFSIRLDTTELDRVAKKLDINRKRLAKRIAFEVENEAKQFAKVVTGAMMNSIYTVTQDTDGYSRAASAAKAKNPDANIVQIPKPYGEVLARVGPCVDYGEFVEFGTSRMGAQPYLTPAVEKVAQEYNDGSKWEELVK